MKIINEEASKKDDCDVWVVREVRGPAVERAAIHVHGQLPHRSRGSQQLGRAPVRLSYRQRTPARAKAAAASPLRSA